MLELSDLGRIGVPLLPQFVFINLIKTSKNKNHFILKKSQRNIEVVPTLFYFINTYLATNQNENNIFIYRIAIPEKITSLQDILSGISGTPIPRGHLTVAFG